MRILVTGGAGYIGSVLVPLLLAEDHEVTVVDNFGALYSRTSLLGWMWHPNLTIVEGDVRDRALMSRLLKTTDTVIALAAVVGAPACDRNPIAAKTTNLDAIMMLLEIRNDQKILYACTNSGYGLGQGDIHCTEETPLRPISLYGRLKVEAEKCLLQSGETISLRLATVFGISPSPRVRLLVNDFVNRAVNDKYVVLFEAHFKRNYIHVRDVVWAFVHSIDNFETMKNEAYNVGLSEANLSKWELCEEIKKQVPDFYFVESPISRDPDKRDYIVSNVKIEATGFESIVSLQDGITELIKGYQAPLRGIGRDY